MRICVLQSSYDGLNHALSEHDPYSDPSNFTDQHTFEHRWIKKATAKDQIDTVVAEGFDFYFNFMWGQHEDEVAGIEACKYFESFGLPSIGLRSSVLERSKNDFYRDARAVGSPRVPGTSEYPLFVKPAKSCASQGITDKSKCRDREELVEALDALNKALAPGREIAGDLTSVSPTPIVVDGIEIPEDIVVQEFVEGTDFSVVVIDVGGCPVPLSPERYFYPANLPSTKQFLTFDVKFHHETHVELLERSSDPSLFDKLQEAAVAAFQTNKMHGNSWCNVDIRIRPDSEAIVIEVNPMPAVFLPKSHQWEDIAIRKCFPGGHRALINTLIATYQIRQKVIIENQQLVANTYDGFSERYDELVTKITNLESILHTVVSKYDFSGTVLDLACGTGLFGRILVSKAAAKQPQKHASSLQNGTADDPFTVSKLIRNTLIQKRQSFWRYLKYLLTFASSILSLRLPSSKTLPPMTSEHQEYASNRTVSDTEISITGVELSAGMATKCEKLGAYGKVYQGSIQSVLPALGNFDHIACFSALHFLSNIELPLVLARVFQLARKSATFTVDDIPEEYNKKLEEQGQCHMRSENHTQEMEAFGVPVGWKLVDQFKIFGWKSHHTGHDVYTTVFRFEREEVRL